METIKEGLVREISNNLLRFLPECQKCKQFLICKDQEPQGPRFCWDLIKRAIMDQEVWVLSKGVYDG